VTAQAFDDYVAYTRLHFEEGLLRAGFRTHGDGWAGCITGRDGPVEVIVTLSPAFPFKPPRVIPADPDRLPWSWHREIDGALCLVAEDDHEDLWWSDASEFVAHIAAWVAASDGGWANDRPDLDLERYFEGAEDRSLYLYDELSSQIGSFVRFRPGLNDVMELVGVGVQPRNVTKRHRRDRYGYVADLGTLSTPPRSWSDISALISTEVNLDRRIRDQTIQVVVLRYDRDGHEAAVVVEVWPTTTGDIAVRRLRSAADTLEANRRRAGPDRDSLDGRRVAIVGVGAIGSFVADMLVRVGVSNLTLVDGDIVKPGNLVRHLIDRDGVGKNKAQAVKDHLIRVHRRPLAIDARTADLDSSTHLFELLDSHDLVINATADFSVTALLHTAAAAVDKGAVSVAMQNDGTTLRIDLLPPLGGASPFPPSTRSSFERTAAVYDAGCGSPISPTPPHAVLEAAAAATRHAVGLLVGRPVDPAGELRHLLTSSELT
jgi:hypothetical protein